MERHHKHWEEAEDGGPALLPGVATPMALLKPGCGRGRWAELQGTAEPGEAAGCVAGGACARPAAGLAWAVLPAGARASRAAPGPAPSSNPLLPAPVPPRRRSARARGPLLGAVGPRRPELGAGRLCGAGRRLRGRLVRHARPVGSLPLVRASAGGGWLEAALRRRRRRRLPAASQRSPLPSSLPAPLPRLLAAAPAPTTTLPRTFVRQRRPRRAARRRPPTSSRCCTRAPLRAPSPPSTRSSSR